MYTMYQKRLCYLSDETQYSRWIQRSLPSQSCLWPLSVFIHKMCFSFSSEHCILNVNCTVKMPQDKHKKRVYTIPILLVNCFLFAPAHALFPAVSLPPPFLHVNSPFSAIFCTPPPFWSRVLSRVISYPVATSYLRGGGEK